MADFITCNRCHKDISYPEWVAHRDGHVTGFQTPAATPTNADPKAYDPETYEPKWRRESFTLSGVPMPVYNDQLTQNQPRNTKRNPALDELIERKCNAPKDRPSGHSLIR